jgi:hypothetical protein
MMLTAFIGGMHGPRKNASLPCRGSGGASSIFRRSFRVAVADLGSKDVKSPTASEHGKLKTAGPRPTVAGGDNRALKINKKAHRMFLHHGVASLVPDLTGEATSSLTIEFRCKGQSDRYRLHSAADRPRRSRHGPTGLFFAS